MSTAKRKSHPAPLIFPEVEIDDEKGYKVRGMR